MLFPNRLQYELSLFLNLEQLPQPKPTMFRIINEEESVDLYPSIDLSENILIIVPSNDDSIIQSDDGTLSIQNSHDINLSGYRILPNNSAVIPFITRIKFSIPRGIRLNFDYPINTPYINKIYISKITRISNSPNDIINDYLTIKDISLTLYIDLEQVKEFNKTIVIKEKKELVNLVFTPIYTVDFPRFPSIQNVYLIKNTELYNQI